MGIYDREYYRDDEFEPQGFRIGGASRERLMVTNIVIFIVAIYVLDAFTSEATYSLKFKDGSKTKFIQVPANDKEAAIEELKKGGYKFVDSRVGTRFISEHGLIDVDVVQHPWKLYQLLTYGFVHSPLGSRMPFHVAFNMLGLWMLGRYVEQQYGRFEFLRFFLVAIVFSGLVWLAIQTLIYGRTSGGCLGASGAVLAVVTLFIVANPQRTLMAFGVYPIKAWVLGVVFIAWDLLATIGASGHVAHEAHLAGAAFGAMYHYFGWNFQRMWPSRFSSIFSALKPKPKLRVVDSDDSDTEEYYDDLDEEGDRILEKIKTDGMESLSRKERRILENYSRRMKQKHR